MVVDYRQLRATEGIIRPEYSLSSPIMLSPVLFLGGKRGRNGKKGAFTQCRRQSRLSRSAASLAVPPFQ